MKSLISHESEVQNDSDPYPVESSCADTSMNDATVRVKTDSKTLDIRPLHAEKLIISSGYLLSIDQFMLGNGQFIERVEKLRSDEWFPSVSQIISEFGGAIVSLSCGNYHVIRDPRSKIIAAVHESSLDLLNNEHEFIDICRNSVKEENEATNSLAKVAIDTRCVVLVDLDILRSTEKLTKYRQMRLVRDEKLARDYIREAGAAVRYGFGWEGEVLSIYRPSKISRPVEGSQTEKCSSKNCDTVSMSCDNKILVFSTSKS